MDNDKSGDKKDDDFDDEFDDDLDDDPQVRIGDEVRSSLIMNAMQGSTAVQGMQAPLPFRMNGRGMDSQSRTVNEVCPGPTSVFHRDATPDEAFMAPELAPPSPPPEREPPSKLELPPPPPKPKLRPPPPPKASRAPCLISQRRGMHPQGRTVDEERPRPAAMAVRAPIPIWMSGPSNGRNKSERSDDTFSSNEKWINLVRNQVNSVQPVDHREGPCTIFMVPKHIRWLDCKAYEPAIAFLGPWHYDCICGSSMNDDKWRCVRHLLSRHRNQEHASQLLNECLLKLKKQDKKVRSCYSQKFPKLSAQDMAVMMLLDGCFIIYLMLNLRPRKESLIEKERKKEKGIAEKREEEEVGMLEGEATEEDEGKKRTECMIEMREGEVVLNIEEDEGKKRKECTIEMREGEVVLNIEEKDKTGEGIAKEIEEEDAGKLEGKATEEVALNIEEKDEQLEGRNVAGLFTANLVVYDLLKLTNQIPFFIIQLLFDHLKACEDGQINLVDLALQLFKGIHPEESESFKKSKKSPDEYHHLLHLFYSSRIPSKKPVESISAPGEAASSQGASTSIPTSTSASGCISELMKCKWKKAEVDPSRGSPTFAPKWIPSATELNRAGVKFERKEQADSFLNIKFQKRKMKLTQLLCLWKLYLMLRSGRMEIPPLQIYDYTGPLFRNLIAFEQCYFDTEMYFTIYTLFMDCIIDQAEDVQLLRLKGILEHKLGNDQEVADLFNRLGSQIHYVWEKNYLANQIEEVNRFYEVKWHKRLAALRRDYLRNPWTTISVLAAVFLLLLTVEQAVFAALSYIHSL